MTTNYETPEMEIIRFDEGGCVHNLVVKSEGVDITLGSSGRSITEF